MFKDHATPGHVFETASMPLGCFPFLVTNSYQHDAGRRGRVFVTRLKTLNNHSGGRCFQAQFDITEFYLGSLARQK